MKPGLYLRVYEFKTMDLDPWLQTFIVDANGNTWICAFEKLEPSQVDSHALYFPVAGFQGALS